MELSRRVISRIILNHFDWRLKKICDDRCPVSTSIRPIFNFLKIKKYRKTILYIFIYLFSLFCHYSFHCKYFIQFHIGFRKEINSVGKLSQSLLFVSTSQFYIYKGQIGIVFGTIVCICYLWVIGYRVRLRG
jgi:hypothetical protein